MQRRTFLTGNAGLVGASLAGCLTVGEEPIDQLQWSTSLDVNPDPSDARDLAFVDGTLAAVTANALFGVGAAGDVRWERLEYPSAVFPTSNGFLGVDWPGYHPRNATNEAVLKLVSPDGATRWRSESYRLLDLAVGPDLVFVLYERSNDVALAAASLADGDPRWVTPVGPATSAVRTNGDVVVTTGSEVVAYDPRSGRRAWTARAFAEHWPPAVDDRRVYLTSEAEPYRVLVIDAADGRTVSEYEIGTELVPSGPLVVRDGVGIGTGTGDDESPLFAVDASTGDVRWRTVPEDELILTDSPRSAGAFLDGTAFLFSYKYVLRAIDLASGAVSWSFDAEKAYPVVTAGDDAVYVLAGGTVHALDPTA